MGECRQGYFVPVGVEYLPPQVEDGEVVADQVGVVGIVGDEYHTHAAFSGGGDEAQHHAGLFHTEGRGGFVEDDDAGAEVDGASDRDNLALAAGELADFHINVGQVDAHVVQLVAGDGFHFFVSEQAEAGGEFVAEEEIAPYRHLVNNGQGLVHGGDAGVEGVAGAAEYRGFVVDQDFAGGWGVESGKGFNEGGFAGTVVAENTGDCAFVDGEVDSVEGGEGAVGFGDIA